jgi:hypothetical protein
VEQVFITFIGDKFAVNLTVSFLLWKDIGFEPADVGLSLSGDNLLGMLRSAEFYKDHKMVLFYFNTL